MALYEPVLPNRDKIFSVEPNCMISEPFIKVSLTIKLSIANRVLFFFSIHEILRKIVLRKMIEEKRRRQKYSFDEFIKRRDAKLTKKRLKNNDSVPSFAC